MKPEIKRYYAVLDIVVDSEDDGSKDGIKSWLFSQLDQSCRDVTVYDDLPAMMRESESLLGPFAHPNQIIRCEMCRTFMEIPDHAGIKTDSLIALPVHWGKGSVEGLQPGHEMILAEHLEQPGVCRGSEGLARVRSAEACEECGSMIPSTFDMVNDWHCCSCSLYPKNVTDAQKTN